MIMINGLNILLFSLAIIFQVGPITSLWAEPYIPQNDSVVLEQLPTTSNPQIQKLRKLRTQLSNSPNDLTLATRLARAYIQLGHTNDDPRYDGYAQAALTPWWNLSHAPTNVLILRATLRQRQHDFDRALQDLDRVLQQQPRHAQAWLTQAVIQTVRGHYHEARRSCLLLRRLTNTLVSTTCLAHVMGLNGHAQESFQALQTAMENETASSEEKLWTLTILAEMAMRLGNTSEAERYFQDALTIDNQDTYLLAAYSDYLLDQRRPAVVRPLLENTLRSDGLLLRLALAEQELHTPTLQQHIETLKARFAANRLRGDARHLREESRFTLHLLHKPKHALNLALENWSIQREPWDARIVLEAALQSGDSIAAQPIVDWLTSKNVEDVELTNLMEKFS
ncbi:tetratricopeptide repeat protein [Candidatus Nitrospira salsa]